MVVPTTTLLLTKSLAIKACGALIEAPVIVPGVDPIAAAYLVR
jgi:hypothetical protein